MGAGLPANTGEARAIHHRVGGGVPAKWGYAVAFNNGFVFAVKPASTRLTLRSGFTLYFQAAVALDRAMMYPF